MTSQVSNVGRRDLPTAPGSVVTRMTNRCLIALALLAALALVSHYVLQAQIDAAERSAAFLDLGSRQRTSLQYAALLADELVAPVSEADRRRLGSELRRTVDSLEKTHHLLIQRSEVLPDGAPPKIEAIYFQAPWLLDTEMRNYIAQARTLLESAESELIWTNPHFQYVHEVATSQRIQDSLAAVADTYGREAAEKTLRLEKLARWSLLATSVVLVGTGLFLFRPMIRRVGRQMRDLDRLNEDLEERVAQRTLALRDSEAFYRALVDNLPMCVLRKDGRGRFTFANRRFLEWIGRPLDEVTGKTDDDFYPAELAQKYREDDARVREDQGVFETVEEHVGADGRRRFVQVLKAPLRDGVGCTVGTQTVFWDVTERKQAEERIHQAERLAAIGQMVTGVAHESRNSLQQIQACAQMLEWRLNGDGRGETLELVRDIQTAEERLLRLFDDLRNYAGPLRREHSRIDVPALIQDAWESLAQPRTDRAATLDLRRTETAGPFGWADRFQVEQVFRNILENSLAACGDPVHIEVRFASVASDGGAMLQIAFRDNGPGPVDEVTRQCFEPFFTTKTRGTGLGLSICQRIVEAHGGQIELMRAERGGAETVLTIPQESKP